MSPTSSAPTSPDAHGPAPEPRVMLDDDPLPGGGDPALVVRTCANCGAAMDERKCKLICRCGYFLSCSDYY